MKGINVVMHKPLIARNVCDVNIPCIVERRNRVACFHPFLDTLFRAAT